MQTRKIKASERPSYLHEQEFLAVANPGPGNYNPRVLHIHNSACFSIA